MKIKGQSLIEFAVILMSVTVVAFVALQIISAKINSHSNDIFAEEEYLDESISTEESDCRKMGLHWDKQNGLCEAK